MASFESLFPTFLQDCTELNQLLQIVAFALFIVGTILTVAHRFTGGVLLRHMLRLFVLTALLAFLPQWGNQVQSLVQSSIISGLGVDPSNVQDQYNQLLVVKHNATDDHSWWDMLANVSGFTVEVLVSGVLWLVGQFASLLLFWAYIIQKFILFTGYALSPLLIGMMAIYPLRSVGARYLTNLVGVMLWPLGWAMAALITQGILDYMTDPSLKYLDPTATAYSLQESMGVAVIAFWIVFSTVAAPLVIQKVFSDGMLAGGQLIAGATGSFIQTASSTVGAAVMASPAGPVATAGAGALAASLTSLSTAAGLGNAGSILTAASGLPTRSARGRPGDDITGDSAVRELITKLKIPR
jgi:hypothetical protein